jgi:hypothetical protein
VAEAETGGISFAAAFKDALKAVLGSFGKWAILFKEIRIYNTGKDSCQKNTT